VIVGHWAVTPRQCGHLGEKLGGHLVLQQPLLVLFLLYVDALNARARHCGISSNIPLIVRIMRIGRSTAMSCSTSIRHAKSPKVAW
jgi:hypothetical protein